MNGVCFNEHLLSDKQIKREPVDQSETLEVQDPLADVSRSVPDIERAWRELKGNNVACNSTAAPIVTEPTAQECPIKRRSESEPNLVNASDEMQEDC